MAKIHNIYYGGEERQQEGTVRSQKSTPDGKHTWDVITTPQGFWPSGVVYPKASYKMAAENGGLKNQPHWRMIAPSNYDHNSSGAANGEDGIGTPYDAGLSEYFKHNPLAAGDTLRLAFIPRGYKALWAQIRVQVPAKGMVADLEWIKSDGTKEVLAANIDFGVVGATGVKNVTDGADANGILDKSDNYFQLAIKTPPDNQDQYRYLMDYDVSGFDYMDI